MVKRRKCRKTIGQPPMYMRYSYYCITLISLLTLLFIAWFIATESHSSIFVTDYKQIVRKERLYVNSFLYKNHVNILSNDLLYENQSKSNDITKDLLNQSVSYEDTRIYSRKIFNNRTMSDRLSLKKKHKITRIKDQNNSTYRKRFTDRLNAKVLQRIQMLKKMLNRNILKSQQLKNNGISSAVPSKPLKLRNAKVVSIPKSNKNMRKINIVNSSFSKLEKSINNLEKFLKIQRETIKSIHRKNFTHLTDIKTYSSRNKKSRNRINYKNFGNSVLGHDVYGVNDNRRIQLGSYYHHQRNKRGRNILSETSRKKNYISYILNDSLKDKYLLPSNMKQILIYSRLWGEYEWDGIPRQEIHAITQKYRCPVSNCVFTYDRRNFNKSDAVLFHQPDERGKSYLLNLLNKFGGRQKHQRWIFFTSESPISASTESDLHSLDNDIFNVTMTYDGRSDIFLPYGRYRPLYKNDRIPKLRNFAAGKLNAAVWYASNCGSQPRNEVIEVLQEYIPIYVGGGCAEYYENQTECPKSSSQSNIRECSKDIQRFKLYLSFESAICDDYVTEKYWENAIQNEVLPIVLSGANGGKNSVIIPGSYIDVFDFESLHELGKYLQRILQDDDKYNKYFEWKKKFRMIKRQKWPYSYDLVCYICAYINKQKTEKIYQSISSWWSGNKCRGNKIEKAFSMVKSHWEKYPRKSIWSRNLSIDDSDFSFDSYNDDAYNTDAGDAHNDDADEAYKDDADDTYKANADDTYSEDADNTYKENEPDDSENLEGENG